MIAVLLMLAAPAAAGGDSAAAPQQRRDQRSAWAARQEGRAMPLREIERRVVPQVPGADYLGADWDEGSAVYTLKFLRDGRVIWVEVDGGTGQVVGRSGR